MGHPGSLFLSPTGSASVFISMAPTHPFLGPLPQSWWSLWSLLYLWPQDLVKPSLRMSSRLGFQDSFPVCPQARGLRPFSVKPDDGNGDFSITPDQAAGTCVLSQDCHLSHASLSSPPLEGIFSSSSRPQWASLPQGLHKQPLSAVKQSSHSPTHPQAPVSLSSDITSCQRSSARLPSPPPHTLSSGEGHASVSPPWSPPKGPPALTASTNRSIKREGDRAFLVAQW